MEQNFFVKAHGLGNEYITLDQENITFELTKELIVRMCNIHFGIGSDGILLKVSSLKADFGLRILNPDGSEAEKSGNGLRIFAKYLFDWGFTTKESFTIETLGGVVTAHIIEQRNGKAFMIKVDMGQAIFRSEQVPVSFPKEECFGEMLRFGEREFLSHCVSVGNPHCVILQNELNEEEVRHFGPIIENHPMFPNRINVQFVKVLSRSEVEIRIWERGAGYTLASGSSSSAVAVAMFRKGLTDGNVTVKMPGGQLQLEIDANFDIRMTGEVRESAFGIISNELLNY